MTLPLLLPPQLGFCDVMAAARAVLLLRLGSPSEALSHLTPHGEATEQQRNAGWRLWLTVQAKYFLGDLQVSLQAHKQLCTPYGSPLVALAPLPLLPVRRTPLHVSKLFLASFPYPTQEALGASQELHRVLLANPGQEASEKQQQQGAEASQSAYAISSHVTVPSAALVAELGAAIQQQLKLKVRVAYGEGAYAASYRYRRLAFTFGMHRRLQHKRAVLCCPVFWIEDMRLNSVLNSVRAGVVQEEGNAAIKAGRHQEAVDRYTAALALGCPPAYAAVLHCNRAAAHSGLGAVAEAVADCGRARALDPTYYKAACRLAGGRFRTRVAFKHTVRPAHVLLASWRLSSALLAKL